MRDHYRITDLLGKGAYGEARKCVYKKDVKNKKDSYKDYRAVKILSKAYMGEKDYIKFYNEVEIMKKLSEENHPNIVKIYHYFEDPKRFLLVNELCAGGELAELFFNKQERIKQIDAAFIIQQILSAVKFMHDNNVIHRDLKPENILLDIKSKKYQSWAVKLIDYGTAKITTEEDEHRTKEREGTLAYMAPEVIKQDKTNQGYNKKCDLWSIGVIAYLLLHETHEPPTWFKFVENPKEMEKKIRDYNEKEKHTNYGIFDNMYDKDSKIPKETQD